MSPQEISAISRVGFLVLNNFSMIAFANALEPLRMANYLSRKNLYSWFVINADSADSTDSTGPASGAASNGLSLSPMYRADEAPPCDILFVCGGTHVREAVTNDVVKLLRVYAGRGTPLGGLCTGTFALAKAGLLNGYRCAIHWENLASIREEFPAILFSSDLFVIDRSMFTCTGGTAPLDLMLNLIRLKGGKSLASDVSEQFSVERIRDQKDQQHIPLLSRVGFGHEALLDAAVFMEMNIEEPFALDVLAEQVGLSLRQLERLFKRYLNITPAQHYLNLRLRRGREFLLQTNMSVMEVTVACGFQSSSHFCKSYRSLFGYAPSRERHQDHSLPPAPPPAAVRSAA
ncbi:AraC family transcriptional regulator, glycine betaine-responsive activator [Janthinobacterium sp. CG_23.3]|uniref:GlxA family transcriptional regulator n=2 Tax=unclassified Janthinobacterium TaxID=2610881 RepID=UPI002DF8DFE3|nr:transcriptional regulator GlxA family with amidase domain [Janthinobacterium sp. CG_S6]